MAVGRMVVVDTGGRLMRRLLDLAFGAELEIRHCTDPARVGEFGCEVLIITSSVPEAVALLSAARSRDPDGYRILAAEDPATALAALGESGLDAILTHARPPGIWHRTIQDGCEAALTRRHYRAVIDELSGSNLQLHSMSRRLQAIVEERTANLEHAHQLLREQHEEMVRLETQAVVSQIARGLAHELNNPLAAILGYAQRLRRSFAKDADAVRRLDVILGEVDRCHSLVEQLRNLATPLAEEPIPCHPDRLLTEAVERCREAGLAAPSCTVLNDIPPVLAAPQSLLRVFEQVLDNAVLAGARQCTLRGQLDGGRVRLVIGNDGASPDETSVRNATRPFYTTMADSGHRGLGLSIALALLRDQIGTLELTVGESGSGAACVVTLPACPSAPEPPLPVLGNRAGLVLVVDDEPLVAELLLDALGEDGLAGRVVGNVAEALRAVQEGGLRALIVDVRLPDGSGVDFVRQALQLRPELANHVALVTGSGDARDSLGLPPGATWPVLSKPFRMEQITRLVRSIA